VKCGREPDQKPLKETIMKIARIIAVGVVGTMFLAARVQAADAPAAQVTLTGKLACAMCVLKQKDVKSCTNVLVVPEAGKDVLYALAENPVVHAYEMAACEKALPVKVTGTVAEKAGKRTLTASRIEKS
jgi:hypothetical protein